MKPTHLEVTPEGIFVIENCPEEPELCKLGTQDQCEDRSQFRGTRWVCPCRAKEIDYAAALASCKRIRCADQEQAKKLAWKAWKKAIGEWVPEKFLEPGIYSLPDVEWEVKEETQHNKRIYLDHARREVHQVAILKESPKESQEDEYRWPSIVSEKGLHEAVKKHDATVVDGRSEFALAWRLCVEWVQKHYILTRNK